MVNKVERFWIVDDDMVYRFTTEKYIQMLKLPIEVRSFDDGEEALSCLRENVNKAENLPDIVMLDVNMPIMDGWDFLEEYEEIGKDISKEIRIYMVSSSIDERDQNRSKANPLVTDYIIKPITEEYLKQLVLG